MEIAISPPTLMRVLRDDSETFGFLTSLRSSPRKD